MRPSVATTTPTKNWPEDCDGDDPDSRVEATIRPHLPSLCQGQPIVRAEREGERKQGPLSTKQYRQGSCCVTTVGTGLPWECNLDRHMVAASGMHQSAFTDCPATPDFGALTNCLSGGGKRHKIA